MACSRRQLLLSAAVTLVAGPVRGQTSTERWAAFLAEIRSDAEMAGVSRATFDRASASVPSPDPAVLKRAGAQGEFSRPIGAYVEGAASAGSVARGRALAATWRPILAATQTRTGVPPEIVLALWSMESGYGRDAGSFSTLRSLATLAFSGSRGPQFRAELIAALRILETEGIDPARLTGSWAGAMGQPQFMPSSFLAHATDGDGDGRRDIWKSPPDVIASIGTFVSASGWRPDFAWGYEVALPPEIDLADFRRPFLVWSGAGVKQADGTPLPSSAASAQLFFPAGRTGPIFLLTDNFEALRAYNTSDAYALAVGILADRIAGAGKLSRLWPSEAPLTGDERREIHERLALSGLYDGLRDGKFGARTRAAVRVFQASAGLPQDGYAGRELLNALRASSH